MSNKVQNGTRYIFVAYVTDKKTGERRYARDYGKKAWHIPVANKRKA